MLGRLLDRRYQIIQVLGGGGFGQTYIAQDTRRPGSPKCVVKHLKPASSDPRLFETAKRLFNSEAESLEQLGNHDQIPRLLAYFDEEQEFYLVQEFIEGHPLSAELMPGQRWNESQIIDLLQQVLGILEFVHSQGVIHRDIKPDNIIRRNADRKLVLVDFGAVKQLRTQVLMPDAQPATVAIGTPGYMPTEQAQGKPRPNSDIYALGIIAIQALTGLMPMQLQDDPNTGEILWQHLVPVSPGLAAVLTKMVRYHFIYRYQTASEALQDLQRAIFPPATPPRENVTVPGYPPTQRPSRDTEVVTPRRPIIQQPETPVRQSVGSGWHNFFALLVGLGATTAIVGAAAIGIRFASNNSGSNVGNNNNSSDGCFAVVIPNSNIRSEPTSANSQNIIQTLTNETKLAVTGKRTQSGWIEVKIPQVSSAWAHLDVIRNGREIDRCLRASGTPIEVVADAVITNRPVVSKPKQNNSGNSSEGKVDKTPPKDDGSKILEKASEKYQSGDLAGAIALLQSIPKNSSTFIKAGEAIAQWQQEWSKAEAKFNQINQAFNEGKWDEVLANKDDLPDIKYWRDQLQPLFTQAAEKQAEAENPQPIESPSPTPTESPSPTENPSPTESPTPTESPQSEG